MRAGEGVAAPLGAALVDADAAAVVAALADSRELGEARADESVLLVERAVSLLERVDRVDAVNSTVGDGEASGDTEDEAMDEREGDVVGEPDGEVAAVCEVPAEREGVVVSLGESVRESRGPKETEEHAEALRDCSIDKEKLADALSV